MRRLELGYLRPGGRSRLMRYVLAAAAVAFTLDAAWYWTRLKDDIALKEAQLSRQASAPKSLRSAAPLQAVSAEEYAFARDTVARMSTPWDRLFQALESAQTDRIALLAIEPDAEHRTVTIVGEAKDYLAALSYVASLSEQGALKRVHLVRHEPQKNASRRPLGFTISAGWTEER
jgi:hypothetical protein